MGRRIKKGQRRKTPALWKEQSEIKWKRISEVSSISQSIKQNAKDLWKHVEWAKASSDKEKEVEEAGSGRKTHNR
tara:strand:+ start:1714 stop:1938 length:225 start_codon:yes stop_codon:yes gene_type:complete